MSDTTTKTKTKISKADKKPDRKPLEKKKRVRDDATDEPVTKRAKVSDKDKLAREKSRERARREKEKLAREKAKEKAKRDRERAAKKAAEVRERIAKNRAREKERKEKAREKAKLDRERKACPKRLDDVRKPMSEWDVYRKRMVMLPEFKSMHMTEQTSALSELYKQRTEEEIAQDAAAARADRERHERETAQLTPAQIERRREIKLWKSRKNRQKNKELGKPPRAKGAFILFSEEVRADVVKAHPDARFEDVASLIGERWKSLTEEQQEVYKERARILSEERRIEVEKWYSTNKSSSMEQEQDDALNAAAAKKKHSTGTA